MYKTEYILFVNNTNSRKILVIEKKKYILFTQWKYV